MLWLKKLTYLFLNSDFKFLRLIESNLSFNITITLKWSDFRGTNLGSQAFIDNHIDTGCGIGFFWQSYFFVQGCRPCTGSAYPPTTPSPRPSSSTSSASSISARPTGSFWPHRYLRCCPDNIFVIVITALLWATSVIYLFIRLYVRYNNLLALRS